jgi:mRNA interferase RelE/StbE
VVPEVPQPPYGLRVARPAAKDIANDLPEAVAAAVVEFITGDLLRAPHRVGKPLQRELEDRWAARRGSYRVLYDIDEHAGVVTALAAEHRRDVYRRR